MVKATQFTDTTKYTTRTAQANADQQNAQHAAQLSANQAVPLDATGSGKLAAPVAKVPVIKALQDATATYANDAAGFKSGVTNSIDPVTGKQVQSPVQTVGDGAIQEHAIQRLRDSGMTDDQIRVKMADPAYIEEIKRTMSNTGLPSTDRVDQVNDSLDKRLAAIDRDAAASNAIGNNISSADIDARKQTAIAQWNSEQQANRAAQADASKKAKDSATSSAEAANTPPPTPEAAGAGSALANLPPEAAALAPYFQSILDSITQGQNDNASTTDALLNGGTIDVNGKKVEVPGVTSMYDAMDKKIADMESGYMAMQEGVQGMLDKVKEQQDQQIADQEKTAKEQLAWNELQQTRQNAKDKQAAIETKIARLALTNSAGSDGGLRDVEETSLAYEAKLDDIKSEFGVQRTDLAAKISGLYLTASTNHLNASISNIKDTMSALERVAGQSLSTTQARVSAENDILGKFISQQTANRKEFAGTLKDAVVEMNSMINENRDDKRAQEKLGWDRMEWASKTFGSDTPQAIIDSISEQLPGVDIKGALTSMTLAEMKQKKIGTGGGGLSFPSYLVQGTGQPPSFESFVANKEKMALASGAVKFDTSPAAMAGYQKEYAATLSAVNETNPTEIMNSFEQRAAAQNLSGPVYKRTQALLENYIKNKQYSQAAAVVSNIGDDVPSTESMNFEGAITSRNQVQRLHGAMADLSMVGPISGRLSSLNPYDPRVIRVKNMITQTVPGLARGIFHEVGVLTDTDVARYTQTLENPNLTVEEAQNAYNDLMKTIDTNIQTKIKAWDANNKRTAGYKAIFDNSTSADADVSSSDSYSTNRDAFLSSLPQ